MSPRMSARHSRLLVAGLASATLLLTAACGNRNSHEAVVSAAGGQLAQGDQGLVGGPVTGGNGGTGAGGTGTVSGKGGSGGTGSTGTGSTGTGGTGSGGTGSAGGTSGGTGSGGTKAGGGGSAPGQSGGGYTGKQDTSSVMICQIGSFTGQAGPPLAAAQPGLASWVRWTNAHGGLAGHPVVLDSKDDAADNNRAMQEAQNCVQNEHAVAIVGAFTVLTADAIGPYLQQHKVPVVGGDALTHIWYSDPYFFPEGASPLGTATGQVLAWKHFGKKTPAVIYCQETPACSDSEKLVVQQAKALGVPVKSVYQVSLANPSFTSQCSSMKSGNVDAVYVSLDGPSLQRLARDCHNIGFKPLYTTGGMALDAVATAPDPNVDGLTVSNAVFPWMTSASQPAKDFQQAMQTYAPDVPPQESAAIAWTSGALLAEAIAKVGAAAHQGPITSAMIVQGLGQIKNDNLGGLVMGRLSFTAGQPATPDNCVGLSTLSGGQWAAPNGANPFCAP